MMTKEPAFFVILGTKDISLREVMGAMFAILMWFVFGWMALGAILGNGYFGLIGMLGLPLVGIYVTLRTKGEEGMPYEEWLAHRLNYLFSPQHFLKEDQEMKGSPDMEMLVYNTILAERAASAGGRF